MTDEERLRAVQEITGIDIASFMRELANMDPRWDGDECIFCKTGRAAGHAQDCMWAGLALAVLG